MKQSDFIRLTPRQQHVMVLAIVVRNALEGFHATHLSDAQMKALNTLVRTALYSGVIMIETSDSDDAAARAMQYFIDMIPNYWEVPGEDDVSASSSTGP